MLYSLFTPLVEYFQAFNLFHYVTFRAAFAAILSFSIVLVCGPGVVAWLRKKKFAGCVGHDSQTLIELRKEKQEVPTMGGLLILLSVSVSVLLLARLDTIYVVVVFLAFLAFGGLGAVDDWLKLTRPKGGGLSAGKKLLGQFGIAAAALVALYAHAQHGGVEDALRFPAMRPSPYRPAPYDVAEMPAGLAGMPRDLPENAPEVPRRSPSTRSRIGPTDAHPSADHRTDLQVPFFKHFCLDLGVFFLVLGALVIVGTSNAVNLTDGMDGLAVGCIVIAAGTFAAITYIVGRADISDHLYVFHVPGVEELAVVCAALGGAGLGFLWFNGYPATVFMGDTGSLALGGALGLIAVAARQELTLFVAGGVFVAEAVSVILQRGWFKLSGGKRLFRCAPLHHHFEFNGAHEAKITVRFWIVAIILSLVALSLLKLR